jgi:alcohol dehydrogenase (quinone), cytochrome c subunit
MRALSLALLVGLSLRVALCSTVARTDEFPSGEYLARAGNCVVCHTASDGKPFAGGLPMATPVGIIYTTNITPDRESGIGTYTIQDFDRAVRKGIAKDGHRLYPAMPYPSYAKITNDDLKLLYQYFMNDVPGITQANQASEIAWPWNMRWPLALWTFLMTDGAPYRYKPEAGPLWNRGAYLVQGLGHCGACHTPRGWAFQEKALDEAGPTFLSGARLDNWYASNLTGNVFMGLGRWSEQEVVSFLKSGRNAHGAVFGTMTEVVNASTQHLSDGDLAAVATYLKSLPAALKEIVPATEPGERQHEAMKLPGAALYVRHCESCHGRDGAARPPYLPPLAGNPAVNEPDPASLINLVLNGSSRIVSAGAPDLYRMPPFRTSLEDQDIANVVNFIRSVWGNSASAARIEDVAAIRRSTNPTSDRALVYRMR